MNTTKLAFFALTLMLAATSWAQLPFEIDQPASVASVTGELSSAEVLDTITQLSAFPNRFSTHHPIHHSADWIKNRWELYSDANPLADVAFFNHTTTAQPSVVLTIPGSTNAEEIVILGASQDSTSPGCTTNPDCIAPGADENASGIAALTEIIRVITDLEFQPQRTLQFMAYGGSLLGLKGSREIAAEYELAGVNVVAVLNLDKIAFHGSAADVALVTDRTDPELNQFVIDLLTAYFPELTWTVTACNYGCADHDSWNAKGYPATYTLETKVGEHNPRIRTVDDTAANIDLDHAMKFVRLAAAFAIETSFDGGVSPVIFQDGFKSGDTTHWSNTTAN